MKQTRHPLSFVVFSDDWGVHPSSCQHLFKRIAVQHRVVWVNTIGMRNPSLTWQDLRKSWNKIGRMFLGKTKASNTTAIGQNIIVLQPPMLPYSAFRSIRALNQFAVTIFVRRALKKNAISKPIFVTTVPNASDFIGKFGESAVVYYCVDDFGQWPGLEHKLVLEMENQLIAKSNIFVATSQKLFEKLAATNKTTYLLNHGVDLRLFAQIPQVAHICLRDIPYPRIGYFGLIDQRTDKELLAGLAAKMPDLSFVMAGPIATDISMLKKYPNIYFTGTIKYEELPALVSGLQVLFIPYLISDFTNSISPLKLREYLMTGRPVVATPMPEILSMKEFVTVASSVVQWRSAFVNAFSADFLSRQHAIQKMLAGESWDEKAEQFLDFCTELKADGN